MTAVEVKACIDKLTDEERFFAAAYFQHRAQEHDPTYQAMLAERMNRMDAGGKVTLEEVRRIHQSLEN